MAYTNADYEIKATLDGNPQFPNGVAIADVLSSGTLDTWLPLSANQTWTLAVDTADVDGTYVVPVDFTIRNKHTLEIVSQTSDKFLLQMNISDGYVYTTLTGQSIGFNVDEYTTSAGTASGKIRFNPTGTIQGLVTKSNATLSGEQTFTSSWYSGIVDAALYEIKATVVSTDAAQSSRFSGDTTNWLSLSSAREWALTLPLAATDGNYDRTFTFQIREAAAPNTVVCSTTGTFGIDAFVSDQDVAITNTLVGDDVSVEIDEFATGGTASVTIQFKTDGTYLGTVATSNATVGGVNESFSSRTWLYSAAPPPSTQPDTPPNPPSGGGTAPDDSGEFSIK